MSLADRAAAAAQAEDDVRKFEIESLIVQRRTHAILAITQLAETFGIDLSSSEIQLANEYKNPGLCSDWEALVFLTTDAVFRIGWTAPCYYTGREPNEGKVSSHVVACDQLLWNLKPGELAVPSYNQRRERRLIENRDLIVKVKTLADIGHALEKIEKARASWTRHYDATVEVTE